MMGDIVMSIKELQRVRVMEQVMGGSLSLVEASGYLGLSYRQSKRLKASYSIRGPVGLKNDTSVSFLAFKSMFLLDSIYQTSRFSEST